LISKTELRELVHSISFQDSSKKLAERDRA